MKKVYLVAILGLLTSAAFSQVKWGGQIIGNLSSAQILELESEDEDLIKKKSIIGYGFGFSAEVPLAKEITLRPSLNLLKKGVEFNANFSDPSMSFREEYSFTTSLYYAELPVNLAINGSLKSGKYFFGFGPSFGLGLTGKAKTVSSYQDAGQPVQTESEELDAFASEDDNGAGFKRFEVSGNIIAGVQLNNGFYANAGYLVGFTNSITGDEGSYKSKGLQLTLGMFFSKK
jgi:hypothetical protein